MPLLQSVIDTNAMQPLRIIELLRSHFGPLAGLKVAVLGLAFKQDTDDVRESPSLPIIRALVDARCRVTAYDPVATDNARIALPGVDVCFVAGLAEALASQHAVVIATRWGEFERIPELLRDQRPPPLVVDGRRMLEVASVGRYTGPGAGIRARNPEPNRKEMEHT
jgi:UDPglucose 6-dehydrogenase/GDP-mannose 6-dehydrogenase